MSDHDPDVSPEHEARLRSLLAQARHGEPVPVDVAARLDRVLEQLEAEGPDPQPGHSPIDLAARRRRRVRTLLVAAAAVVVVGVGIGQVLPTSQEDATSASSGSSSEDSGAETATSPDASSRSGLNDSSQESAQGQDSLEDTEAFPAAPGPAALQSSMPTRPRPPVRLSADNFADQAALLRERPGVRSLLGSAIDGDALSNAAAFVCDTADWGSGKLLAALYDAVPSVLAYRPVAGETQTVDLLRCGTGEVLRSTVLPMEE